MEAKFRVLFAISAIVASTVLGLDLSTNRRFMGLTCFEAPEVGVMNTISHTYPHTPIQFHIQAGKPFIFNKVIVPTNRTPYFTFFNGGFSDSELLEKPKAIVWSYDDHNNYGCLELFTEDLLSGKKNMESWFAGICFDVDINQKVFAMNDGQLMDIAIKAKDVYMAMMTQARGIFPLAEGQDPTKLSEIILRNGESRRMEALKYLADMFTERSRFLKETFISIFAISMAILMTNLLVLFVFAYGSPLQKAHRSITAFFKGVSSSEVRRQKIAYSQIAMNVRKDLHRRICQLDKSLDSEGRIAEAIAHLMRQDFQNATRCVYDAEETQQEILARRAIDELLQKEKEAEAQKAEQQILARYSKIEQLCAAFSALPDNKCPPNIDRLFDDLRIAVNSKDRDWRICLYNIEKLLPEEQKSV